MSPKDGKDGEMIDLIRRSWTFVDICREIHTWPTRFRATCIVNESPFIRSHCIMSQEKQAPWEIEWHISV